MLENYLKLISWRQLLLLENKSMPHIVLTRSRTGFIGKSIQGFMRLWQWTRGSRNTRHIPNHADAIQDNYAIGALIFGVDGNDLDSHFSGSAEFFVIKPIFDEIERFRFWYFLQQQEGEKYAYWDLMKYAWKSFVIWAKWKKEPLDREKWTCFSLIASALNYAYKKEIFPKPYRISPVEFIDIIELLHGKYFDSPLIISK